MTKHKTRILFVLWAANLGGVQSSIHTRIRALQSLGVDADILFRHPGSGLDTFKGVTAYVNNNSKTFGALVTRKHYDAISFINITPSIGPLRQVKFPGKLLFELRGLSVRGLSICMALSPTEFGAILVPSRYVARLVEQACPATPVPVHTLPNAVDTRLFRPLSDLSRKDIPPRPVILWVGRLDWNKNFIELLRIIRHLLQQRQSVTTWVVADAGASKYLHRFHQAVHAAGLTEQVRFFPNVPRRDMPRLYNVVARSGGCVLSTSRSEGLQNTLLEGMACGCPVVSSAVGGNVEIITDAAHGSLYPLGDPATAAAQITRLLTAPHLHRQLAKAGLKRIKSHFSPRRHALAFLDLLERTRPAGTHSSRSKKKKR